MNKPVYITEAEAYLMRLLDVVITQLRKLEAENADLRSKLKEGEKP